MPRAVATNPMSLEPFFPVFLQYSGPSVFLSVFLLGVSFSFEVKAKRLIWPWGLSEVCRMVACSESSPFWILALRSGLSGRGGPA